MKLHGFIKDIELFLQDKIGFVTFLNKLDDTEEELLELEEKKGDLRTIIVKALEFMDNIRIMIDSPSFKKDNLRKELEKLSLLIKELPLKEERQFMTSKPDFEAHPGMKARLPSVSAKPKEPVDFIKDLKRIREIDRDTILDKLDSVEEYLLEKEELCAINKPEFRNVIITAMEIVDNIRIILDEHDELDEESLRIETGKWIRIEHFLKTETVPPVHKVTTPVAPGQSKISLGKEIIKNESPGKNFSNFMVAKPGFEVHPGMKEKLPSVQSPQIKEIEGFSRDIKKFLSGQLEKDIVLDKMETVEENLLDMEEFAVNSTLRGVIVEALEVLDNIRNFVDESPFFDDEEFGSEIDRWLKLEHALKKEQTPHTVPERINHDSKDTYSDILKKATSSEVSSTDELLKKVEAQLQPERKFILSRPEFEAHPGMKDRLPVEKHEAISSEDEKNSPLYIFLQVLKKYISGYGNVKDVTTVLEDTNSEIVGLIQDLEQELGSEDYSNDSLSGFTSMLETIEDIDKREFLMSPEERENKEKYLKMLEEILDILSCFGKTIKEKYHIEDVKLLTEDLKVLNVTLLSLQQSIFLVPQEIDEEEELIKNIVKVITEDDILTTNYLDIKDGALNFLRGEIDEDELIDILDDMKDIIDEAKEEYDEEYTYTDGWALESATGDKILRQGIKEWEESLDILYDSYVIKDEPAIHRAINKAYEANKKLIINQKLEEFINDQVMARSGYSMDYF
mgnify:CR=1 FL=1